METDGDKSAAITRLGAAVDMNPGSINSQIQATYLSLCSAAQISAICSVKRRLILCLIKLVIFCVLLYKPL